MGAREITHSLARPHYKAADYSRQLLNARAQNGMLPRLKCFILKQRHTQRNNSAVRGVQAHKRCLPNRKGP